MSVVYGRRGVCSPQTPCFGNIGPHDTSVTDMCVLILYFNLMKEWIINNCIGYDFPTLNR